MKKVTDVNVFMAWAMERKLKLTPTARAKITAEVRRLHIRREISEETYHNYLRIRKTEG